MKLFDEFLQTVDAVGDDTLVARKLRVYPEFIKSWRPRQRDLPDGRTIIEQGWEPSSGFMAASLGILRS